MLQYVLPYGNKNILDKNILVKFYFFIFYRHSLLCLFCFVFLVPVLQQKNFFFKLLLPLF